MSITNAYFQAAEGVGKKIRAIQRSIGGDALLLQGVYLEDQPYDTFVVATTAAAPGAADHVIQLMGSPTKFVYLHRLEVYQQTAAGSASLIEMRLLRVTTAGGGGTAETPRRLDPAGNAVTAAVRRAVASSKGTEGETLDARVINPIQTVPGSGALPLLTALDYEGVQKPKLPMSSSDGIVLKALAASTANLIYVLTFSERDH